MIPYTAVRWGDFRPTRDETRQRNYGTTNSTSGAYKPKPGYVGKDYFEVEISYGTKLKTTLQANVTITD